MVVNKLFVEKYRPQTFDDFIGANDGAIAGLAKISRTDPFSLPNLILESSAGTGKTTLAKIIVNEIGADCLYLNASDERGIDVIRLKVKEFASTRSFNNTAPKIVHLDEADGLTVDAQNILRNLMEEYSFNCRFILTCNQIQRIIEPLVSRCKVIHFGKPSRDEIRKRLLYICEQEDINVSEDEINILIDIHYPDIRSMIKALDAHKTLGDNLIQTDGNEANKIYACIKAKKITSARQIWTDTPVDFRYMVYELFKRIWNDSDLTATQKINAVELLCEMDFRMVYGANQEITFTNLCLQLMKIVK